MNDGELQRLSDCLSHYPAVVAYLFGSVVRGGLGPLSDLDVALLFDTSVGKSERFDLRLRLSSELSALMGRRVDLVILNDVPVHLAFEVIKDGRIISCRDNAARVDFEKDVLSRYLDRRFYDKRHAETVLGLIASRGLQTS